MAGVLGCPSRGTGECGGHHDGGGLRGPAHGARHVVSMVTRDVLVLCSVDVTIVCMFKGSTYQMINFTKIEIKMFA